MQKLNCPAQKYAWGKVGNESTVAKLLASEAESNTPYAELWMGTHPNGPAKLENGQLLSDFLKDHPEALAQHEKGELQFLFKVLSVAKALSVQSHPTNEQARILHQKDPKNYPDPHHKPEIAIALTNFELLCGFRQPHDLLYHIKANAEITTLFDEELLAGLTHESDPNAKEALRNMFTSVWKSPADKIASVVNSIVNRLSNGDSESHSDVDKLILRLNVEHPGGDVGVLAPIFLNYFTLKEGESTFLGPNEPHAYLSDCIECMACSDNTIRAGLTPKFKDTETLCSSLTYRMTEPPYFNPKSVAEGIVEYSPPVPEFAVQKLWKAAKNITPVGSSSILIVIDGNAKINDGDENILSKGSIVFIPANTAHVTIGSPSVDFKAFRAYTPAP